MLDLFESLRAFALWFSVTLAFVPAALNWFWTSRFRLDGDQHALPERHWALAQRVSVVTSACAAAIAVLAGWSALWILPIELVALACTNHRTRRLLFAETWPLHRYLLWRLRMFVGVWALWVCVALLPGILANTPAPARWWVAGLSFVVALAWHRWYTRVLLVVLGATRLVRPDLDERFLRVFSRAQVAAPTVWRAGAEGGRFMNALALPALTGNGVLFFDTLLERLSPDEITAILAHEVAHLEHYAPRLRRLSIVAAAIILTVIVASAALPLISSEVAAWLPVLSIVVVFGGFSARARRMQPKETEADLRAVELCENPDALTSALTHVYTMNHVPRRWSARTEEQATHPSLAKRLADIRRHTDAPDPPPSPEHVVIASTEPGRWAVVEHERITFLWGVAEETSATDIVDRAQRLERLPFSELNELRLASQHTGALTLTAADRHGRRWSMPLHEHDAARVQDALDRVDHLIVPTARARVRIGERLIAMVALMMALAFGAFGAAAAPALLIVKHPARRLMMALSIALIGTAAGIAVNANDNYTEILVLAMLSAFALWDARALRQDESTPLGSWLWIERVAFVLPLAIGAALIAIDTRDLYDLHVAVRERPWFAAAALTLAAFVWWSPQRRERRAIAAIAASVGAAALLASSPWFLVGVVRDDLAASMPELTDTFVSLTATSKQVVDGRYNSISLAPEGGTFLLAADVDEDEANETDPLSPRRFVVGAVNGWSRSFEAPQAALVDAHRLLVLERTASGSSLRAEDTQSGRETWTLPIDSRNLWLIQAAPDGRWRALKRRGRQMVRIEGRIDSTDTHETTWTIAASEGYADSRVSEGPLALGIVSTWQQPILPLSYAPWRSTTTLVRAGAGTQAGIARSRLRVDCPLSPIGVDGIVCVSFDGRWSRFWRFDPRSGQLSPAGQRHGGLWSVRQLTPTLLTARDGVQSILISLDSQTSTMLRHPWGGCGVDDLSIAAETIATACAGASNTRITFYRLPAGAAVPPLISPSLRALRVGQ